MLACEIVTGFLFTATPIPHGAAWRENHHAGARKAECLPRLRGCGKMSEQILEKLAPATLTPIAIWPRNAPVPPAPTLSAKIDSKD